MPSPPDIFEQVRMKLIELVDARLDAAVPPWRLQAARALPALSIVDPDAIEKFVGSFPTGHAMDEFLARSATLEQIQWVLLLCEQLKSLLRRLDPQAPSFGTLAERMTVVDSLNFLLFLALEDLKASRRGDPRT